ncbi:hypothetical protein MP228_003907 [Amoeboaphelidium protococcarum]|nr:hypothetical protein MP228_003907 [Amoeboaphelidium protococcarum]
MSQFKSVYTSSSVASKDQNSNNPQSIYQDVKAEKKDVFLPATMTKLTGKKQDQSMLLKQLEGIKDNGMKNLLLNTLQNLEQQVSLSREGKYVPLVNAYAKLDQWLLEMRDPVDGVGFMDRKKLFDTIPAAAIGSEIFVWLQRRFQITDKDEVMSLFQKFIDFGYLCPLDVSQFNAQNNNDSYYTFQADLLLRPLLMDVADLDYAIHLLRRSAKNDGKFQLNKEETERFYEIEKNSISQWKAIVQGSDRQKAYLSSLDKGDRKLAEVRDYAFWRVINPSTGPNVSAELIKEDKALGRRRLSFEEFLSALPAQTQLELLTKRVEQQTVELQNLSTPASVLCKKLVKHCDVWHDNDPFISQMADHNPFRRSETSNFTDKSEDEVPRPERVYLWRCRFVDLMNDPEGLKYFRKFLERDLAQENLDFYLTVKQLDTIIDLPELKSKCQEIYLNYINEGSDHEINIDALVRGKLKQALARADQDVNESKHVLYSLYDEAAAHVYEILRKDCFPRFSNSDQIKALTAGYKKRTANLNFQTSVTDSNNDDAVSVLSFAKTGSTDHRGKLQPQDVSLSNDIDEDSDEAEESEAAQLRRKLQAISSDRYSTKSLAKNRKSATFKERSGTYESRLSVISFNDDQKANKDDDKAIKD